MTDSSKETARNIAPEQADSNEGLYTAIRKQDAAALKAWHENHPDALLVAHDYPRAGEQTMLYAANMKIFFGSNLIQVGFDEDKQALNPLTEAQVGRTAIVDFVEFTRIAEL